MGDAGDCILQFGTSRFLQAHVDLFASNARDAGQEVADIVIVQTTGDLARRRRLAGFSDPAGFPVILRGIENGVPVERRIQVRSVREGVSAIGQWPRLCTLFVDHATHIVSNTGDAGYKIPDEDRTPPTSDDPPASFCGMLTTLLHRRWRAGRPGLTLLPCELVTRNGDTLRNHILSLAADQGRDVKFATWLRDECIWANTLVDRIVSTPLDPAGAIAEPYALWAIERQPALTLPFTHPAMVLTDDLEPYERLKLHILNLGHSWLAERWHAEGGAPDVTVSAAMADAATRSALERMMAEDVVPGFAAHGLGDAAAAYIAKTIERFDNPFLDHQIADIFCGHDVKIAKRIGGFLAWVDGVRDGGAAALPMPELRALAARQ